MHSIGRIRWVTTLKLLLPLLKTFDTLLDHAKYTDGDNYKDPAVLDGYLTLWGNDFRAKTMCLQHIKSTILTYINFD